MSNRLKSKLIIDGSEIYYRADFRAILEEHIPYMLDLKLYEQTVVPDNLMFKYERDFYGLLLEMRLPMHLHWVTLRMNGLFNSNEYAGQKQYIIIPDASEISKIRRMYMLYK